MLTTLAPPAGGDESGSKKAAPLQTGPRISTQSGNAQNLRRSPLSSKPPSPSSRRVLASVVRVRARRRTDRAGRPLVSIETVFRHAVGPGWVRIFQPAG
jgi:hypothetical protein